MAQSLDGTEPYGLRDVEVGACSGFWEGPITFSSKTAVSQALKDSLAYCAQALESIDDQRAISTPQLSYAFLHVIVHNNEIYGNVVGYMRVSGIVPPSTASRAQQKKAEK